MNGLLAGRVALVLGAGSIGNIGQGIARRFALEGAQVMIAGRNALPLETLAWEIGASYELCDITHQSDLTRLTEQVVAKYGALSIAVNATGRNHLESFVEVTRAQIEEMTEVQFIGPFLFLQSIVRAMRALGQGGSIIHVSSVTSTLLLHRHALYMGTKAGIEQVVRSVAYDHGVDGIRINCIAPGPTIDAPMAAHAFRDPKSVDKLTRKFALRRVGTVADVAAAAVWLAMDECFVTGQVIQANGGFSLIGPEDE